MASALKTAIARDWAGDVRFLHKNLTPFLRPLNRSHTDNTHRYLGAIPPPPPPCCTSPTTQPYSQRCHASAISTNHTEQRRLKHGHEMRSRRDEATKASSFSLSPGWRVKAPSPTYTSVAYTAAAAKCSGHSLGSYRYWVSLQHRGWIRGKREGEGLRAVSRWWWWWTRRSVARSGLTHTHTWIDTAVFPRHPFPPSSPLPPLSPLSGQVIHGLLDVRSKNARE